MIKNLIKDSFLYGLSNIIGKGIAFFLIPVYTTVFSVEDYGTMGVIASITGMIGVFMQMGSNNALQRFYFDEKNDSFKSRVITSGIQILLLSSTIVFFLCILFLTYSSSIVEHLGFPAILLTLALISLYLSQYTIYSKEMMRVQFLPRKYFILEIFPILTTAAITLSLLFMVEKTLQMFYTGLLSGAIVGAIVAWVYAKKIVSVQYDKRLAMRMFKFGYPFIFVGLAYWVFQSSDRLMILGLSNKTEVGYYHLASQFAVVMAIVITAFAASWSPYAMKLLNEHSNHRYVMSRVATLWVLVLSFIAITMSTFAENIITLMSVESYSFAANIIPILVFGNFMLGTTQFTVMGISIAKKTHVISKYSWMVAGLNIILNLLLIPYFNALGAAMATAVSSFVLTLLYLNRSQKEYHIPYEYKKLTVITVITLGLILFFTFFPDMSTVAKSGLVLLFGASYLYIANDSYKDLQFEFKI